jgi:hypothetical protein
LSEFFPCRIKVFEGGPPKINVIRGFPCRIKVIDGALSKANVIVRGFLMQD